MLLGFEVSPEQLKKKINAGEEMLILDVRDLEEYSIANIEGAKLVPLGSLPQRLDKLAAWRDRLVVVYCHVGQRSIEAMEILQDAGFKELKMLAGGIDAWCEEIEPHKPRYGDGAEKSGC